MVPCRSPTPTSCAHPNRPVRRRSRPIARRRPDGTSSPPPRRSARSPPGFPVRGCADPRHGDWRCHTAGAEVASRAAPASALSGQRDRAPPDRGFGSCAGSGGRHTAARRALRVRHQAGHRQDRHFSDHRHEPGFHCELRHDRRTRHGGRVVGVRLCGRTVCLCRPRDDMGLLWRTRAAHRRCRRAWCRFQSDNLYYRPGKSSRAAVAATLRIAPERLVAKQERLNAARPLAATNMPARRRPSSLPCRVSCLASLRPCGT